MIVIAAVDDNMGMLFNHRRQSQDSCLRAYLLQHYTPLWMNAYSYGQFQKETEANIQVHEQCLALAQAGEYVFVENIPLAPYLQQIEGMILCRWNRHYPAQVYLDVQPTQCGWQVTETVELVGSSHEKITIEVYARG